MKKLESLSNKRLLINVTVNGKKAILFLDTGASVGMFDAKLKKAFSLKEGREFPTPIIGAGGPLKRVHYCDTLVDLPNGKKCGLFLLTDLSSIVESIKRETGETILGIMSLRQMKEANMQIDFNDNAIIFE